MSSFPYLASSNAWFETAAETEPLPRKIAVGWSGGADSTALLLALANRGHELYAWHIDHAWHAQSGHQAERLHRLADSWGVNFLSLRLSPPSGINRESEARSGRYRAFARLAAEQGVSDVCLAHHREDQAETVCMRMLQGAGARGISAMRTVTRHGELTFYRPLLHVSKEALRAALLAAEVGWIEDVSNLDMTLWRNRLRHRLFPALKSSGVDPIELYMRWQRQAAMVSEKLEAELGGVELCSSAESCSLAWTTWRSLSAAMRATLLQRMMRQLFGVGSVAGRRHIELVETWMDQGGYGGLDLSRSRIMRKGERLVLLRRI